MVITNAATGNPNVKALVYVAAYAPDEGEQRGKARGAAKGRRAGSDCRRSLSLQQLRRPGREAPADHRPEPERRAHLERVRQPLPARSGRARGRRPTTASRTGPAPQSIPFASRVRCLVALGACRRRTALGPGLLAAGPASNSTLLSIVSARASFVVIWVRSSRSSSPAPRPGVGWPSTSARPTIPDGRPGQSRSGSRCHRVRRWSASATAGASPSA
jgi:hypothetical protein